MAMRARGYNPSFWDRRLDRLARRSWMPAPLPWLSIGIGAAAGVAFAYTVAGGAHAPEFAQILNAALSQLFG